jgi:surfactin synthase thioesterase subunit
MTDRWVRRATPALQASARVFCFPHAGVGASIFRQWQAHAGADVEVCAIEPPGRGSRLRESALASIDAYVDNLLPELLPLLDLPCVFFGHSMGAVAAYESVCRLRSRGLPLPRHLFVSARRAPSIPDLASPLRNLPDAEFVECIDQRFGGIPRQIREDAEVLALLLPALRADVAALELHRPTLGEPLPIGITVFGGVDDGCASREDLEPWRERTSAGFALRLFPGNHFFLEPHRAELVGEIVSALPAPPLQRKAGNG